MKKTAPAVILMLAFLIFTFSSTTYAAKQSQVALSCSTPPPQAGTHPANACAFSNIVFPFVVGGFWIWCQNPTTGGTPYGPDCSGSLYYANVFTGAYVARSITGTSSGFPTISFTSSDGVISCSLTISGSSTLTGTCNGTPITFSNVNIQVT
ncbi:MAG TPA: hypothetical protein VFE91_07925 [Nitrososphaerales archaeon]|nr:hypothetical protein [Nitrososphaerales archaeon]